MCTSDQSAVKAAISVTCRPINNKVTQQRLIDNHSHVTLGPEINDHHVKQDTA